MVTYFFVEIKMPGALGYLSHSVTQTLAGRRLDEDVAEFTWRRRKKKGTSARLAGSSVITGQVTSILCGYNKVVCGLGWRRGPPGGAIAGLVVIV